MINTVTSHRDLTLEDRCDSCGAAAKVAATFLAGELLFCGHHAKKSKESLLQKSAGVYDPEGIIS